MIKVTALQELLKSDETELKKLDIEQLRVALGTFRYFARVLEREINRRCVSRPFGNIEENKE
ncbi:MAG: hypothetical protein H6754_03275 [Candidatus Omnitrophica bacterium]|nr:hypothetical protein [Candidatus Omnitrophota bacterium]